MNFLPLFSEFRCIHKNCAKYNQINSLSVVPGSQKDPILRCESCKSQEDWQKVLRVNTNLWGSIMQAILALTILLALLRFPLNPIIRIAVSFLPFIMFGFSVRSWIRYSKQREKMFQAIQRGFLAPIVQDELPVKWRTNRAELEKDLAQVPKAKKALLAHLQMLDTRVAAAQKRVVSLESLTNTKAKETLQKNIDSQEKQLQNAKSNRAKEIHKETLSQLENRQIELANLQDRKEELQASLSAATACLKNIQIQLASLREIAGGQLDKEVQSITLDLKSRLTELESLID